MQTELGITTVFVTHDQDEALAISDRVAVMEAGRIAQLGTPEELYRRPATAFVADFVGLSNQIEGEYSSQTVKIPGATLPVHAVPSGVIDGARVTAYVRPEHVSLERATGVVQTGELEASVVSSGFLGAVRRTIVQYGDRLTLASQHGSEDVYAAGDRVRVRFLGEPVTIAE